MKADAAALEVLELNRTLEERVRLRTAELETINGELQAFSYSVSHDLRAPLRTIDGFSLALEEDYAEAVDATGRDYIRRVRAGTQRMGQLIDSLLQLSRITRAELTRTAVDISGLAEMVAQNLREEWPERELHFEVEQGLGGGGGCEAVAGGAREPAGERGEVYGEDGAGGDCVLGGIGNGRPGLCGTTGLGSIWLYKDKLFNAFNRLHGDKGF